MMTSITAPIGNYQAVSSNKKAFVPMQFALSRLPLTQTALDNNGISTRFRQPAKLSTVSLVGRYVITG